MRGFRKVGRVDDRRCFVFDEDAEISDGALITSSPDILGFKMREGWWRKRDVTRVDTLGWHNFVQSATCGDYLFVVTALGENCFK